MSKVIVYTRLGNVEIIVPAPQSLVWGRRVLKVHEVLLGRDIDFDPFAPLIDVTDKEWSIQAIKQVAKRMRIPLTEDMYELEDEDEFLDRLQGFVLPATATNVRRIEAEEISETRDFRNAWEQGTDGTIQTNMPKARSIHMGKIRDARVGVLSSLDKDWSKFTGQKKTVEADEVEAKRQALRDIPQTFDLERYTTTRTLLRAWPKEIERP